MLANRQPCNTRSLKESRYCLYHSELHARRIASEFADGEYEMRWVTLALPVLPAGASCEVRHGLLCLGVVLADELR